MKRFCVLFSPLLALSFLACPSNNTLTTPVSDSFNTLETTKHKTTNPITEEVFWENDGSHGEISWTPYFFTYDGSFIETYVAMLSKETWKRIETEIFYMDFEANASESVELTITDGGWASGVWPHGESIKLTDPLITDHGDGTYTLELIFAGYPIVDYMEGVNGAFQFTGQSYTPQKLYFKTGHACNLELVKGKNPTLLRPGYKSYYVCTVGGEYYEDAEGLIPIADIENWKVNEGKLNPILNMGEFVTIVFFGVAAITWIVFIIIDMKNGFIRLKLSNITYSKRRTDEPKFDEYVVSFDWENRRIHYYIFKDKKLNATLEDVKKEFNRDRHNGKLKRYIRKLIAPVKSK